MLGRLVAALLLVTTQAADEVGSEPGRPRTPSPTPLASQFRDGIRKQHMAALESRGESITIMCVGESGLGKTSLLSSLFQTELDWPDPAVKNSRSLAPTSAIAELVVPFDLDGVPFTAKLVDSPGYGDLTDLTRSFSVVTRYLEGCFRSALRYESQIKRGTRGVRDQPVDVSRRLRLVPPLAHRRGLTRLPPCRSCSTFLHRTGARARTSRSCTR